MQLRPYQQAAAEAAISWIKKSIEPACLELATGAGKSLIVSAIALWVYENTGKRVLCLAPSKELTQQNYEKYIHTGNRASIFCASIGKSMAHPVVFGTPQTVKNSISRFGDKFAAVIIDEAHGITPTIKFIIDSIREKNKRLRVIGLSATPYRTGSGYIYQYDADGSYMGDTEAKEPYFNSLLYRITASELIEMGFLTQPHADPDHAASYDTSGLSMKGGRFSERDVERAFEGRGRLTSAIIADVVSHATLRLGVMIFAATIQHARECCESLPPEITRMVDGSTPAKEREQIVADFKAMKIKYLVNVAVYTTGFDAPHVDLIAILRATESPGLFQQIIGRGLRLHEHKSDCLILDYAENIERHGLHDDLFRPVIKVAKSSSGEGAILADCPDCGYQNRFSMRPNPDNFPVSADGYFMDLAGQPIDTGSGPMPAHFGRRCTGQIIIKGAGIFERCEYRWTSKECAECGQDNDIAARYCIGCKAELVDPNEKLQHEFQRIKKDPYTASTDKILAWDAKKTVSQKGAEFLLCTYTTEYRTFKVWYSPDSRSQRAQHEWRTLSEAVFNGHIAPSIDMFLQYLPKGTPPTTITSARQKNSSFFTVIDHNRPEDKLP